MSDEKIFDYAFVMDRMTENYEGEFDPELVIAHVAAIEDRLVRSKTLQQLAKSHTILQFGRLPQFEKELLNSIISLVDKQPEISTRGINSIEIRARLKSLLLEHCELFETLIKQS